MIKLIATDIDGTLVPDGTMDINPEIFEVINRLHKKGIQFAAASGREWSGVEWLFRPVAEKIFYLSDNGAYVGMHGRNLFLHPMEKEYIAQLLGMIRKNPAFAAVGTDGDECFLEERDEGLREWIMTGYHTNCRYTQDLSKVDNLIKISAYDRTDNVRQNGTEIRKEMSQKLKIMNSGTMWLDANAKGVSKGEAIRVLQDALSILPEETMAFGDQANDIDMLKSAYYSFAVANAIPEAKEAARFEADFNTGDGVLKILKLLL